MLISFDQNGNAIKKVGSSILLSRIERLPADRKNLTHSLFVKRNVATPYDSLRDSVSQDTPMVVREQGVRRSECLAVTARILIEISSNTKVSPRLTGL
ncbi:MAG: hypothetical protein O3C12_09165 [Proteobacteria bacterium]|nr:hypothetical protein [Pseudomonadota bacterium]